jgi:hypothetical protein
MKDLDGKGDELSYVVADKISPQRLTMCQFPKTLKGRNE